MHEDVILEEERIAKEREADAERLGAAILREPIREVASLRAAACVPPTATVREAIECMKENGVGYVLIQDMGKLLGIFTERDVLTKIVLQGHDIDELQVESVMTPDPEVLSPDDRVSYALNKMSVGGFRHIPLVDRDGRAVGAVSMRNVVDFMVDLFAPAVLTLPPEPGHVPSAREGA
jgi:CBS domain-containing protein